MATKDTRGPGMSIWGESGELLVEAMGTPIARSGEVVVGIVPFLERYFEVVWSGEHGRGITRVRWDVRTRVKARDMTDAEDASRVAIVDTLPDDWLYFLILKKDGPRIFTKRPSLSEIPRKEMRPWIEIFRYEAEETDSPLASGDPYKRFRVGTRRRRPTRIRR